MQAIQALDLFGMPVLIPPPKIVVKKQVYSAPEENYRYGIIAPEEDRRRWCIVVRPNSLLSYYSARHHQKGEWRKPLFERKRIEGELSPNAVRKMQKALKWLVWQASEKEVYEKSIGKKLKYRVNFITLSFKSNLEDDKVGRKILSMWLEMAKYRFNVGNYVWRAETQERGAIHFHLVTDVYIPYAELRFTWNRLLCKFGLGTMEDNSTDVHAVKNIKNTTAYLVKYLSDESKQEGRRKIKGRLWGCNKALSNAGKEKVVVDTWDLQVLQSDMRSYSLATKLIAAGKPIPEILKHCDIWELPEGYFEHLPECALKDIWLKEIETLRNVSRNKRLQFWQREE